MEAIPLPSRAKIEEKNASNYKVILEPLYPGYGVTIGNTLRRVLLSSMPGSAVTAIKIKFVDHEFSTIPNVKEDVIQIILNIKQLRVKSFSTEPVRLLLKAKGEKEVTAADIKETDQVQIINKDLHIATLDNKSADFEMELVVQQGRGYNPVEAREHEKLEIGMISIDAIYTPIRSVHFDVSNVRVGQLTNFDKLEIAIETDGTISGSEAVNIASHILVDHFSMMFTEVPESFPTVLPAEEQSPEVPAIAPVSVEDDIAASTLSNRAKNALAKKGIISKIALNALTDEEINSTEGLGEKTIKEIKEYLGR